MRTKRPDVKLENGASRSHRALQYELLPKAGVDRVVQRLMLGAGIHGAHNWKQGGPEFVAETRRHMVAHLLNYLEGDTSDDHLGALLCNGFFLAHFESKQEKA